jgi:6-phosphogluconate dehydrogenase (decarboxylating)
MKMKKQIVVVGLGRLGESIARTLITIGHEVLALDKDVTPVQAISPFVTHAVQTDPTSDSAWCCRFSGNRGKCSGYHFIKKIRGPLCHRHGSE